MDYTFVKRFDQLSKNDVAIAGGKGASLGEMTRSGIPVPEGFVILADAFDRFSKTKEIPSEFATDILGAFHALHTPFVAVRSSATSEDGTEAAWAGQLESYLNTTEETLIQNVQRCWDSLFTPRAVAYRHEKGLDETPISVAVVVQRMIDSAVSGITFTAHPVTENRDQMVIEACWGLGELIVGGRLTPDAYIVDKRDGKILEQDVSPQEKKLIRGAAGNELVPIATEQQSQQKLTHTEIHTLSKRCCQIEQHYGYPCDIEWAMKDGAFFILQARPITTFHKK